MLVFLVVALSLFISQKATVDAAIRDTARKTSVNAIYYSLEDVYYKKTGYYPESVEPKTLTAIDPALLKDPDGFEIGDPQSSVKYESSDCSLDGKCKQYTLRADLEKEAEYTKTNRVKP